MSRARATCATKREAQEWAARRETELRAEASGQAGTLKTLLDALRRYANEVSPEKRGWRAETVRLHAFEKQTLPVRKKIAAVTTADIAQWRDDRLKINARGSVLRDLTLLGSVMETARREWGWIKINPVRDVRKPAEPDHRERIIHRREIRAMLAQLGCRPSKPPRGLCLRPLAGRFCWHCAPACALVNCARCNGSMCTSAIARC